LKGNGQEENCSQLDGSTLGRIVPSFLSGIGGTIHKVLFRLRNGSSQQSLFRLIKLAGAANTLCWFINFNMNNYLRMFF